LRKNATSLAWDSVQRERKVAELQFHNLSKQTTKRVIDKEHHK